MALTAMLGPLTISIHAPARGATDELSQYTNLYRQFQSTLPQGERRDNCTSSHDSTHISIHAPARGATDRLTPLSEWLVYFNPRSRKGSDLQIPYISQDCIHFNPRSRKGSDPAFQPYPVRYSISIHAPARGATLSKLLCMLPITLFQSTLPQGERPLRSGLINIIQKFQSTLPQGERPQL